jgi:hypothetical protein
MKKILFISIFLLVAAVAFFLFVNRGNASLYSINTDDGSVSEWFTQGIPLFQTDAITDTARADEDIWKTWVAMTNDDNLAFLVQMAAGPALDGDQYRAIVASLDCQPNDIDLEGPPDKIVYYFWEADIVAVAHGDSTIGLVLDDNQLGQRVDDYLEWKISKNKISECYSFIKIRFYSASSDNSITISSLLDNSGDLRGFWMVDPDAVRIKSISTRQINHFKIVTFSLPIVILLSAVLYFMKDRILQLLHMKKPI